MQQQKLKDEHDTIVEDFSSRFLVSDDFSTIKADLEGWEQPDEVEGGFRPDITAHGTSQHVIVEVETNDSLDDHHTADQLKAFHRHSLRHSIQLWLVIPRASKEKAERLCKSLGVVASILTFPY